MSPMSVRTLFTILLLVISAWLPTSLFARAVNSSNYTQSFADSSFAAVATIRSGETLQDGRFLYDLATELTLSQDGPTGDFSLCSFEPLLIGQRVLVAASSQATNARSCEHTHSSHTNYWIVVPLFMTEECFEGPTRLFLALGSDEAERLRCSSDDVRHQPSRPGTDWPSFFYSRRNVFFPLDDFVLCVERSVKTIEFDTEPAVEPEERALRGPDGV